MTNSESSRTREVTAAVRERIAQDGRVRLSLPGGRIHIDRPLPVLALHRMDPGDPGTADLVLGQGSYLIAGADVTHENLNTLVKGIVEPLADRFGAFLIVELWGARYQSSIERWPFEGPRFRVISELQEGEPPIVASALRKALLDTKAFGTDPKVEATGDEEPAAPGREPILRPEERRDLGCLVIGLEIPPAFRSGGEVLFPEILRKAGHELAGILHQVFFTFAEVHTTYEPQDFRELGRHAVVKAGREIDSQLSEIAARLDFLLHVTPVNAWTEWEDFRAAGFTREPRFHYRPLAFDPDFAKRSLFEIEIDRVEDPTIAYLLREKRHEIDRLITMLEDREKPNFMHESAALYGGVEPALLGEAKALLELSEPQSPTAHVSADMFAVRAREELAHYEESWPSLESEVQVRSDVPGIMVVHGDLMIGADVRVAAERVEPLINHEVGTHIVTAANGSAQSLKMLSVGLPGHEETQEGLAVFSEFVSGGLGIDRMRVLAGRVLAVHRLLEGRRFVQVFRELHEEHKFEPKAAWSVTMRVFRSGGLTKDAIYLRGLTRLLRYLSEGGSLDPLFVGKMALEHAPLVEELQWRRILTAAPLEPRWLRVPGASARLQAARRGTTILDLMELGSASV